VSSRRRRPPSSCGRWHVVFGKLCTGISDCCTSHQAGPGSHCFNVLAALFSVCHMGYVVPYVVRLCCEITLFVNDACGTLVINVFHRVPVRASGCCNR
jgi:hypothetical protein